MDAQVQLPHLRFVLLARAAHLNRAGMVDHGRTAHADLIARMPIFWRYTQRYIQNYVSPDNGRIFGDDIFGAFGFDGIVETWQRPRLQMSRLFSDEPIYKSVVRDDERKVFDLMKTSAMLTVVHEVIAGPATPVKMLCFHRRRPELTHGEFGDWWRGQGARMLLANPAFANSVPELERSLTDEASGYGFSGVSEMRFDTREALTEAFSSEDYRQRVLPEFAQYELPPMPVLVVENEIARPDEATDGGGTR